MAQRRMSRKSFRKSRGRKTRSMRKRTMGGADGVEFDWETGLGEKLKELQVFKNSQDPNATISLTEVVNTGVETCNRVKECQNYKYKTYTEIEGILNDPLLRERRKYITAEVDNAQVGWGEIMRVLGNKITKHKYKRGGRKSRRKRKSRRR